jgi:glutamate-1-semialdehyde 2,1-aminomutase
MDYLAPDGPVYQAGTLSGNPLAMAAGLTQLRELEKAHGWQQLEEIGAAFEHGIREACASAGKNLTFHRLGSLFSLFFTEEPVRNLAGAMKQDIAAFRRFFYSALERGVYFAPSPFEAGFLSLAHSRDDIERTIGVVSAAIEGAW